MRRHALVGGPVLVVGPSPRVTAYPNGRIANDNWIFVVAERTPAEPSAVWTLRDIKWGKKGK